MQCSGKIDSVYHGSCVDGDGIRSVVFFSGCNLKCPFCHNPETLYLGGKSIELDDLLRTLLRYKNYYKNGGVTLSGGEPFLQADFCIKLVDSLNENGILTTLETNGLIVNEDLIKRANSVRLDIKNQNGESAELLIKRYSPFIETCQKHGVSITVTNVICETKNDDENSLNNLAEFLAKFSLLKNLEFLPFKKMCVEKYQKLGIEFLYNSLPETSEKTTFNCKNFISKY